jgi:hypothetical protein
MSDRRKRERSVPFLDHTAEGIVVQVKKKKRKKKKKSRKGG